MCDYSLHLVASRPAKVGDELVTSRFNGTSTHGFAAAGEPSVALCLLPGTEIAFENEVRYETFWGPKAIPQTTAIFCRMNEHQPHTFHDALEFPGGTVVMLTNLLAGQRARVLQLPVAAAEPKTAQPAPLTTRAPAARTPRILDFLRLR